MLVGPGRNHPEVTQQEHYYMTTPEAALGLAELDPRDSNDYCHHLFPAAV